MIRLYKFSCTLRQLHIIGLNFDWLTGLSTARVTEQFSIECCKTKPDCSVHLTPW